MPGDEIFKLVCRKNEGGKKTGCFRNDGDFRVRAPGGEVQGKKKKTHNPRRQISSHPLRGPECGKKAGRGWRGIKSFCTPYNTRKEDPLRRGGAGPRAQSRRRDAEFETKGGTEGDGLIPAKKKQWGES